MYMSIVKGYKKRKWEDEVKSTAKALRATLLSQVLLKMLWLTFRVFYISVSQGRAINNIKWVGLEKNFKVGPVFMDNLYSYSDLSTIN